MFAEAEVVPDGILDPKGEWVSLVTNGIERKALVVAVKFYEKRQQRPIRKGERMRLTISETIDFVSDSNHEITISCADKDTVELVWDWLVRSSSIKVMGFEVPEFVERLVVDEPLPVNVDDATRVITIGKS